MKFTQAHIQAFRLASHDVNPLHFDADYARRSQFGRPVVYGMAAVLYGLGEWAQGRPFRLDSLRAVFRKPLFEGEEYRLDIAEADGSLRIRYGRGPVDYAVVTADFQWLPQAPAHAPAPAQGFVPLTAACAHADPAPQQVDYAPHPEAWEGLLSAFGLGPQRMPCLQLAALLWTSYHVGMVLPGRQALYSDLQVAFAPAQPEGCRLQLALDAADFDDRFNRYTVTGSGPGVAEVRISAFQRPLPVDFPLSAMPAYAEGYLPLAGRVVFVSGATRGFGAAVARMAARSGARLALNYRGDEAAAQALCAELRAAGADAQAFAADMTDPAAVAAMAAAIGEAFGRIDVVVNNAAPPIRDLYFLEQTNADLLAFVQQNLAITLETARQLLPLVPAGGHFLHVSTKYVAAPVRGFAHYLAAKAAQEALVQALALELREQVFTVVRLPRILTDQTNLAFDFDPPLHPGEVAQAALASILAEADDNYRLVDLYLRWEDAD